MKKRILAVLALLLLFGGTTLAFGYWDNLAQSDNGNQVVIGKGVTVVLNESITPTGNLVPDHASVLVKTGDVTSLVYNYTVRLEEATTEDLDLAVSVDAISNPLLNVVVTSNPGTISMDGVTVTTVVVTITLDLPSDLAAYNLVAGETLTFDLTFTAS
ncbi:MAG: hypothetical protein JEZ05_08160 [Tenericutes bacterium]|nr:hypothetical protein [Mycoplasmatota bacterium]